MSLQSGSFLVMRPLARSPRSLPDVWGRLLALPPGLQPSPLRGPLGLPRAGRNSIAKTDHWLSDHCSELNFQGSPLRRRGPSGCLWPFARPPRTLPDICSHEVEALQPYMPNTASTPQTSAISSRYHKSIRCCGS